MTNKNAYAQSGVDVEAGYEVVERIKKHVARTERAGVMGALGGFGGMFDLSKTGVKEPVLISGTDGVGTKLMLAIKYDKHDTIGQDCVAMCVNDIIAAGAEPLYFLDYVATGKNEPAKLEQVEPWMSDHRLHCLQLYIPDPYNQNRPGSSFRCHLLMSVSAESGRHRKFFGLSLFHCLSCRKLYK